MEFTKNKYYDEELLGEDLYHKINSNHEVLTVQEYFNTNSVENEYYVKDKNVDYKLMVLDNYYQLDCKDYNIYLFLVFDKPVHIVGKRCEGIIAPEIVVKSDKNNLLSRCIANKMLIDNSSGSFYRINYSKINDIYFYDSKVSFYKTQVNNFFIFNEKLAFNINSYFLDYHKIKCFGRCNNLKKTMLEYKSFQKGIIHIE